MALKNDQVPIGWNTVDYYVTEKGGSPEFGKESTGGSFVVLDKQGDSITLTGKQYGQMYSVLFEYYYDDKFIAGISAMVGVPNGKTYTIKNRQDDFKNLAKVINAFHSVRFHWKIWAQPGNTLDGGEADYRAVQVYLLTHDKRTDLETYIQKWVGDNISGPAQLGINLAHLGDTTFTVTPSETTSTTEPWKPPELPDLPDLPDPTEPFKGLLIGLALFGAVIVVIIIAAYVHYKG